MNILWLGDPTSFDVALVGGKAANLSRLARMYHRVQVRFVLTLGRPKLQFWSGVTKLQSRTALMAKV